MPRSSVLAQRVPGPAGLPNAMAVGIPAVLFGLLFWPVIQGLMAAWRTDPDNSHGLLIPFISGYLIWTQRAALASEPRRASGAGLGVLAAGLALYVLSAAGHIEMGQRVALVVALNGAVLYNFGGRIFRRLWFPLLFLFLMIPLPVTLVGAVSFPLQLFATECSYYLLQALAVPVEKVGNLLRFPQGTLEVAEACSGIRSLLSFFSLALVFAYLRPGRWPGKLFLVLSAIPIALGANILRITASGWAAFVYGIQAAEGFLHDFSGFALFALGLAAFFLASCFWKEFFERSGPSRAGLP
jgi:exosortase